MIADKFTTEFTVLRDEWTTETVDEVEIDKSEEVAVGSFYGYRQQASAQYMQSLGLTITKPHIIWCPVDTDVNEGDVLESDFGTDTVRAKQVNRDGNNAHIELIVENTAEEQGS